MNYLSAQNRKGNLFVFLILSFVFLGIAPSAVSQTKSPVLQYVVSMPNTENHYFHVELYCSGWQEETIDFKMPNWMPGYYQLMNYSKMVENFTAKVDNKNLAVKKLNENSWQIKTSKNKPFTLSYDVKADKQFVANSYLDASHAYIIPNSLFVYINEHLNTPVSVKIEGIKKGFKIATGLEPIAGKTNEFIAPDFDVLYDCPLLIGDLEELPSFKVNGIEHRFIGYKIGDFDKVKFIDNLKKVVESAVAIIGDIPYKQYTFIGIGPRQGGIEHLNNTTVSFDGSDLDKPEAMNRMMSFLAHEYFHHYNVKRIRPFELGPFDYDKGSKTNLLWVSEGLSVYYEYLIVKRAGLVNEQTLFQNLESGINAFENSPGRAFQSLTQASFETWSDGPFGKQGENVDKSISYYEKGPAVGLVLDFAIRKATQNQKSLDDVMRFLYWEYYKKMQRGFTDAEFQESCEKMAGCSLKNVFEYVYTTKPIDYNNYLKYADLELKEDLDPVSKNRKFSFQILQSSTDDQRKVLRSWLEK
ncbi:M61 family metallopeptidase [Flavobacterium quisquiliarum]|uniref:M61 family metallopeptidase n=1 Tax=Flavobacterium quisquiliarum TaxID=1834436 RepID=A0ABV8W2T7_9FLAO|nr:M61 family metallopeptidase [Flavobacterium quisquiliarum]MBW1655653.1 M61 family peptidase [Flavobacterium quisquiliarum]NWL03276.1 peptidase M61 [Flavobacterium collinsii]